MSATESNWIDMKVVEDSPLRPFHRPNHATWIGDYKQRAILGLGQEAEVKLAVPGPAVYRHVYVPTFLFRFDVALFEYAQEELHLAEARVLMHVPKGWELHVWMRHEFYRMKRLEKFTAYWAEIAVAAVHPDRGSLMVLMESHALPEGA